MGFLYIDDEPLMNYPFTRNYSLAPFNRILSFRERSLYALFSFLFVPIFYAQPLITPSLSQTSYHTASTNSASSDKPLFERLSPSQTGIHFTNTLPEDRYRNIIAYQYYYNGGGVAIADFNNDSLPDLLLTGNLTPHTLYQNLGNFTFKDITATSGIQNPAKASWSTGVSCVDINADGLLDLYICRSGNLKPENRTNLLFLNLGNFTFQEVASDYGLNDPGYSVQSAFFDYDRDGDLDMYLANHGFEFFGAKDIPRLKTERHPYSGDKLFENQGGKFVDVSEKAGIKGTAFGYGLGIGIADLNRDGWEDIYVSNDFFEHDYLYFNNGDGTFTEQIKSATRHLSNFSMGNDIADYNNDSWPDIMVLDMVAEDNRRLKANMSGMDPLTFRSFVEKGYHYQYMFNTLHLNRANASFSEVAHLAGVSNTDWSWAPLWADFDQDGWLDLYITNGLRKDARNTDFRNQFQAKLQEVAQDPMRNLLTNEEWATYLRQMPSEKITNYAFRNQANLQFQDMSANWGFTEPSWSNGVAYGDLDLDGDLDLVVNNIDQTAFVYRNRANERPNAHHLTVSLVGKTDNPLAVGAHVRITVGELSQYRHLQPSRGFQSSVQPIVHFGLGGAATVDSLIITWPDGSTTIQTDLRVNQHIRIEQEPQASEDSFVELPIRPHPTPSDNTLIQNIGPQHLPLTFTHRENHFDDFEREILLPHKMSQEGPSIAVGDLNGDGLADVFVGGAKGQAGKIFMQNEMGQFSDLSVEIGEEYEDVEATFLDIDGDEDLDLYVVSGGNEETGTHALYQDRLYVNDGKGDFTLQLDRLPDIFASGSCVRAGDIDGDGDQDLFVGGRQSPGAYPMPGQSFLLENQSGTFVDMTASFAPTLSQAGMITDANWIDIDRDKDLDLITVGEWMAVQIWENRAGTFVPQAVAPQTEGWWYSVQTADVDEDGDLDIIAGNLGLNYKYKASAEAPFEVFYKDFDGNGSADIVLSYYQAGEQFPLRGRSCSSQQIPIIKQKFPSYNEFAKASLTEVYGEWGLTDAYQLQAYTFASTWFEQKEEGSWIPHELPMMAQLSAVRSIIPYDINQDQHIDLIVGGNMYPSEVETPRNDAACGLVLLGDGTGDFQALPVNESGLYIPGDVRDMKLISVQDDTYLLVANNDGPLDIFNLTP